MHKKWIGKIMFLGLLLMSLCSAQAQLSHFVYLQTDSRQPFYIRYNNKIYSSTGSGYLILGKLSEGVIRFSVGFPKKNETEYNFEINLEKSDKGYLLKEFAEKGWGLYDLQQSSVVYSIQPDVKTQSAQKDTSVVQQPLANDPFANMLSQVTNDSTVKNVVIKKEEKLIADTPKITLAPPEVKKEAVKKDSQVVLIPAKTKEQTITEANTVISKPEVKTEESVWTAPAKTPIAVIRKFESREGLDYVFEVSEINGIKDTIRVFIAADSIPKKEVAVPEVQVNPQKQDSVIIISNKPPENPVTPEVRKEERVINSGSSKDSIVNQPVKTEIVNVPNSNCKLNASDEDFLKLRKKMASQSKEEEMVNEARKVFKTKCFTSAQLKNLAVLILTDEWKYRFYDAALPFVSDYSNFKPLGETIQDPYYKKRFQALLPNN
jgi:hypothetical protein